MPSRGAARALEARAYYLRQVGTDGYRFGFKETLKKVVNDRRASLADADVDKAARALVRREFERGASLPVLFFPPDGVEVADTHRLTLVVLDPAHAWDGKADTRERLAAWVRRRGESPRLSPGALLWCARRPGRDLKDKVETWLAWQKVATDLGEGVIGAEFERGERAAVAGNVKDAEDEARGEAWAEYRFVILADAGAPDGLAVLDLGPGHRSGNETLASRIVSALKAQNYLNESVGAGYIERKWPEAFRASGAWPLSGLRQAFLNGSLTRLLDVDAVLKAKLVEFVGKGDFGLASGQSGGAFSRIWFEELISADEIAFDGQTFLLLPSIARPLTAAPRTAQPAPPAVIDVPAVAPPPVRVEPEAPAIIHLSGSIPPEIWNRVGNKLIPKLRTGEALDVTVGLTVKVSPAQRASFIEEVRQVLSDLGLAERVTIEAR